VRTPRRPTRSVALGRPVCAEGVPSTAVLEPLRRAVGDGRSVTVYVVNAGDFVVPVDAAVSVQSEKVTFACRKLEPKLRAAIGHAHDQESR
jgi:hypothetical protein